MITEEQLMQLKACDGGTPILSIYLNIPPGLQPERAYITTFTALAQEMRDRLTAPRREEFEAAARRVEAWLEREPPQGRAAIAFCCQSTGLWQATFLPFPVVNHIAFEERPHLTPLLDLFEEHGRYGVVIVDKEQSRLLTVRLGEIEGDQRFQGDIEEAEDHSGWDEGKYDQQYEGHVQQHLKRVASRVDRLHARRPFDRLLLGGPLEAVTGLKALLSPPLAACLVGTFNVDIDMSPAEILERTQPVVEQAEREKEAQIVASLIERQGPNGRGVLGISDTLRAVWNAAVETLVVTEGLRAPGGECTNCGRLEVGNVVACPVCQGMARPVSDVVAWAVDRTLQQSGTVEIVHGDAATRLTEEGEGLGALMRFSQDRLA
jgi:peptide subunit release factor 1 (eRF1)